MTGEPKAVRVFILGGHEDEKNFEDCIPLKVWKMLTPESRTAMKSGEELNIGLVKNGSVKETKRGGGNMY